MKLYLLLIIMIVCTYVAYKKSNNLLTSPILVYCGTFTIATFICIVNPVWEFDISYDTVIVITLSIISFGVGQFISEKLSIAGINYEKNAHRIIVEKENRYLLVMLIQIIFVFIYGAFIIKIGGGISNNTIKYARTWMLLNTVPNIYGHILLLSKAIALVYSFIFLKNVVYYKKKMNVRYLIPIILYLIIEVLSTSRSGIIYFLGYFLCNYVYFYQKATKGISDKKIKKRVIKYVLVLSACVVIVFVFLGNFTGKTEKLGITNMISTYFGASIYALDYYIDNQMNFSSLAFGYNTIPIINSIKGYLGIDVPQQDAYYFPIITVPNSATDGMLRDTNLYTCITKPMVDFGYVGMLILFFLLGVIYANVYYYIVRKKTIGVDIIVYGIMMMPVFCSAAEYVYGSFLFAPNTIYLALYVMIIYKFSIRYKEVEN